MGATLVIVNPHARRRLELQRLAQRLEPENFRLAATCKPGHALELARQAAAAGFAKVLAVGGDGTVNEVLNGLAGSPTALGIIPTGGANDFATHLGLPRDWDQALQVALNGVPREVDLIRVRDRYFATVGGLGIGARVAVQVNRLRGASRQGQKLYRLLGRGIYAAFALREILLTPEWAADCRLIIDGRRRRLKLWGLFVGNQPRLGNTFVIHPAADNRDAWLDVCLIRPTGSKGRLLLTLLLALRGRHTCLPFVETCRARRLRVEADQPLEFFGDGELLSSAPPHVIELAPRALTVMVPNHG